MKSVQLLLTDADNTLWDTNAVYAAAQLRLLERIEEYAGRSIESDDRLGFVRTIDQALALQHPMGLRYPPLLLSSALLAVGLERHSSRVAVTTALSGGYSLAIAERLARELSHEVDTYLPSLRLGVRQALALLKGIGVQIIVLTEGEETRCISMLERHKLTNYVAAVRTAKKTVEVYQELKPVSGKPSYMVGDQLDVDVQFSRAAGFTSVYFPSEFAPVWTSGVANEADFTIASYAEVPPLITRLVDR